MGAVAGLLTAAGHDVRGSDAAVYPPMSEQLAALGVPVMMPYGPQNLDVGAGAGRGRQRPRQGPRRGEGGPGAGHPADLVPGGDRRAAARRQALDRRLPARTARRRRPRWSATSSWRPAAIRRCSSAACRSRSATGWRLGQGPDFVIEGDEYDTAFFDKGPKFAHYRPRHRDPDERRARSRRHLPVVRRGPRHVQEARRRRCRRTACSSCAPSRPTPSRSRSTRRARSSSTR